MGKAWARELCRDRSRQESSGVCPNVQRRTGGYALHRLCDRLIPGDLPLARLRERGSEGAGSRSLLSRPNGGGNPGKGGCEIGLDLVIQEPDHSATTPFEPGLSPIVLFLLKLVYRAIDFYDQSCLGTVEVHDTAINRVLTSELQPTELSISQCFPDDCFCGRLPLPQLPRVELNSLGRPERSPTHVPSI